MRRLLVRTFACGVLLAGVTACGTAHKGSGKLYPTHPPAPTKVPPSVMISADPITPGQHVVLHGNGWQPDTTLHAWLRPQDVTIGIPVDLGTVTTDFSGRFTETVSLPASVATGQWNVYVYGSARSGESATEEFTVKQALAQITSQVKTTAQVEITPQVQVTGQANALPATQTPYTAFIPFTNQSLSQPITTTQPLLAGTGVPTSVAMPALQQSPAVTPTPLTTPEMAIGTPQRVDFAPGSDSIAIPVQPGGASPASWALWALQGQTMTVSTQPAIQITVTDSQGQVLTSASGTVQLPVQQTGDYIVIVQPSVQVTLSISIPPL